MFGSAKRSAIRKVSADFCAAAGIVANPIRLAATSAAPTVIRICIFPSVSGLPSQPSVRRRSSQMTLYHPLPVPDHGNRCDACALLDRDTAAWMEAAAGRDVGGIRQRLAETDVGDAASRLWGQHAREQCLGIRVTGLANSASVSLRSTMRPRYITAT